MKVEPKPSLETVMREMEERDLIDSSRNVAPMKPSEDAVVFDTTNLKLQEQVILIEALARFRQK